MYIFSQPEIANLTISEINYLASQHKPCSLPSQCIWLSSSLKSLLRSSLLFWRLKVTSHIHRIFLKFPLFTLQIREQIWIYIYWVYLRICVWQMLKLGHYLVSSPVLGTVIISLPVERLEYLCRRPHVKRKAPNLVCQGNLYEF